MKAEIDIDCKEPSLVLRSLRPDMEELKKFKASIVAGKGKIVLKIEADDLTGLLAGINTYIRLIRVAVDATMI